MGMHEARGQLGKMMREVVARWRDTQGVWDDDVSRRFEAEVMQVIEADLRSALVAMDSASATLSNVRRDCAS